MILFCFLLFILEQWKPINPEEKKKYDREFLLGFQFSSASMNKPEGLPAISDVVLEKVQCLKLNMWGFLWAHKYHLMILAAGGLTSCLKARVMYLVLMFFAFVCAKSVDNVILGQ